MALPTTGYAKQSVTANASLTDFTLIVNLSDMPAEWWSVVDTSDGTKGRAAKDDETELPVDWIDFDDSGQTGWARVLWSGTLSSVSANTLRVYPPSTDNASVASGNAIGSDNAYDSAWKGYWPLGEAVNNDANGYPDRTSNNNHGTGNSMALSAKTGKVGNAADFSGSYIETTDTNNYSNNITLSAWVKADTLGAGDLFVILSGGVADLLIDFENFVAPPIFRSRIRAGVDHPGPVVTTDTWYHAVMAFDGAVANRVKMYLNASEVADQSETGSIANSQKIFIGAYGPNPTVDGEWDGLIDDAQVHNNTRAVGWIVEEHAQTDDNAVYWGTWEAVDFTDPVVNFSGISAATTSALATLVNTTQFSGTAAATFSTTATIVPPFISDVVAFTVGVAQIKSEIAGAKQLNAETVTVNQIVSEVVGV
jgi:hypothetical protein